MPTRDTWGKSDLQKVVKVYQVDKPTSKGSEVIMQLNRICLLLVDKMESLEANNVAIMAEKSLADKSLLEMKKQDHVLQEEKKLNK